MNDLLLIPSDMDTGSRSVMAHHAVNSDLSLGVAVQTEAHVDLIHWNNSIHGLHRPMAVLTGNSRTNVRTVVKPHEVGKLVNPLPLDLQRLRVMVRPGRRDCIKAPGPNADVTVTPDALL